MFEFDLTLGPLRIRFTLTTPDHAGEYVELATDTELVSDDYDDETTEQDRIGFRGTHGNDANHN